MEKWKKRYIVITAIIFAITCVATVLFAYNVNQLSLGMVEVIKTILSSIFLLIAVAMIVYFVICGIFTMKRGIRNIKKCDDELFKKIDQYKKCWGEDKHYYIKQIQIINLYYEKGGKVDELVKNKEIERLYARADFLLIQNSLFDNLITCFYSLVISVIASFVCQMMECESVLLMFVWMVTILLVIRVREKCFMHRKEKLVRFMTVLETVNVCKTVENVEMFRVRYGLIPETQSFQMKNLMKM